MRMIMHKIIKKLLCGKAPSELEILKNKGLIIGEHTIVHSSNCFDTVYPWLIEVGDYCMISTEVKIIAHDASTNRLDGITLIGRVITYIWDKALQCFVMLKLVIMLLWERTVW